MLTRKEFLRVGVFAGTGLFLASPAGAQVLDGDKKYAWIMSEETFKFALANDPELQVKMRGAVCYVTDYGRWYGTKRVHSVHCRQFADIQRRIDAGDVAEGDNVVWAIENGGGGEWPVVLADQTEPEAQLRLGSYLRSAREMVDAVGATLIASPANNIRYTYLAAYPEYEYTTLTQFFADFKIPAKCARHAHVYSIQAQQNLQNADNYARQITECVKQARDAIYPQRKPVFAGLTTNSPRSRPEDYPTAEEMAAAAEAVRGVVDGYGLSVPPHRDTGERDYAKAYDFLRQFYELYHLG